MGLVFNDGKCAILNASPSERRDEFEFFTFAAATKILGAAIGSIEESKTITAKSMSLTP